MKKRKILIADDDRDIRRALRARLSDWGYQVVLSCDGLGVLAQCLENNVDAVILDHEMPNGDGRTIAHVIRSEWDGPIIFLSGHKSDLFERAISTLPEVYYLPKPLNAGRLRRLLQAKISAWKSVGAPVQYYSAT